MIADREFLKEQVVITSEDIEIITGLDSEGARREYDHLLETLNNGSDEILLDDYCQLNSMDSEETYFSLNPPEEVWEIEDDDE